MEPTLNFLNQGSDALRWSVALTGADGAQWLHNAHTELRTASVGKVFILIELAAQITAGELSPDEMVSRDSVAAVGASGLWRHLSTPKMTVNDAAVLIGTCSDNHATNVLLHRLGLDAVQNRGAQLCSGPTMLHDRVRDVRTADDPATLSTGTAADYAALMLRLSQGSVVSAEVSELVSDWLSTSMDLSMVPGDFGLNPLFHSQSTETLCVLNKTGTDDGIRADTGIISKEGKALSYAAICNWDAEAQVSESEVLSTMRRIGSVAAGLL